MDCEKYQLLLSAYIDGEVSNKEKKLVEAHIKECMECEKKLGELQTMACLIKQEFNGIKPDDKAKYNIYKRLYKYFFIMFIGLVICFTIISLSGGVIQLAYLDNIPVVLRYIFYIGIGFILVGILFLLYDIYVNLIRVIKNK